MESNFWDTEAGRIWAKSAGEEKLPRSSGHSKGHTLVMTLNQPPNKGFFFDMS
jgi:hypothetical protein